MQEYYQKWYRIDIKELGGITVIGDVPSNWYEFDEHYNPIKEWCKKNCKNKYQIFVIDDGYHDQPMYIGYSFYFKYRSDAVAFKLMWT